MYCWYYGTLQGAGIRKNGLRIIGDIAFGLSEMFLILMMILVAKGWTIVRRKISSQGRVKIAVFSTFYVAIYTMSLIWKAERGNMMTVDSEYELPSGRLLFLLQCYLVLWFSYASWTTWVSIFFTCQQLYLYIPSVPTKGNVGFIKSIPYLPACFSSRRSFRI